MTNYELPENLPFEKLKTAVEHLAKSINAIHNKERPDRIESVKQFVQAMKHGYQVLRDVKNSSEDVYQTAIVLGISAIQDKYLHNEKSRLNDYLSRIANNAAKKSSLLKE